MNRLLIVFTMIFTFSSFAAEDGHDHDHEHSSPDGIPMERRVEAKKHDHDSLDHEEHGKHDEHEGHDDHGHGGGKAIGVGKAIIEVDEVKGFKLSPEAIKSLSIKLSKLDKLELKIKKSTLVTSKNVKGIYLFRAGFFKLLHVEIIKELRNDYIVKVSSILAGDQIVVGGVGLLRVTDVYSTDKSEYGHSH
ncbi:hypothetical protein A9Q84_16565 [Halobacteriovorax marinus]|uniref:Uncharacterized protein n=1 Tax=Halobacteriovorax marinus TaxID=97084 RepID=A0A1Y5F4W8_9BACT|nr:hypothetical protein A9Q84_16565 [Halobacteriovorax marinus]